MLGVTIKVAVYAAVTLLLTLYIGLRITGADFGAKHTYSATFDDVTGLIDGDVVKVAGVPVGSVKSIKVANGRADVAFEVNDDIRIPVDSTIAVRWRNPLGQRYLYVVPGTGTEFVADKGRIDKTTSAVDVGELVNRLAPLTQSLEPDRLNQLVVALAEGFEGNDENFDTLLSDLGSVVGTLNERSGTIGQLVTDSNTITAALAQRDQQLQTMVDNVVVLSQAFADHSQLIDQAMNELPALTSSLDALLSGNADELGRTIDNLSLVGATTQARIGDLQQSIAAMPAALQALFSSVSYGEYVRGFGACISPSPPPCILPPIVSGSAGAAGPDGTAPAGPITLPVPQALPLSPQPLDTPEALTQLLMTMLGGGN